MMPRGRNVDRNNLSGILGDYSRLSQTKINLEGNQYRDQVALSNFNPTNGTNMSFGMWSVLFPCYPLGHDAPSLRCEGVVPGP